MAGGTLRRKLREERERSQRDKIYYDTNWYADHISRQQERLRGRQANKEVWRFKRRMKRLRRKYERAQIQALANVL